MQHVARGTGLVREPALVRLVPRQLAPQHLERDRLPLRLPDRLEDDPHSPFAENPDEPIVADVVADFELPLRGRAGLAHGDEHIAARFEFRVRKVPGLDT